RSKRWLHVATTAYWADLRDWSSAVGADWTHERDLILEPLTEGWCICIRPDCVRGMYHNYKLQRKRDKGGSSNRMAVGQSSPLGRYPSTRFQVQALLEHLEVNGLVLDCCGSTRDALSMVLTGYGLHVVTNDVDHKLIADSHMDVTTRAFYDLLSQETRRPDW
ncbi:unnamed protein product, partial [Pylaiella littoralis]